MFKMVGVDIATGRKNSNFSFWYRKSYLNSMFINVWSVDDEELIPSKLVLCTAYKN